MRNQENLATGEVGGKRKDGDNFDNIANDHSHGNFVKEVFIKTHFYQMY